jgi:hypothetical protein
MGALVVLYLLFVVQYGVVLLSIDEPIAKAMGVALLVLPLIGGWALAVEFLFVVRAEKLVKSLGTEGELPVDDLPRLPSGRIDPVAADAVFPIYQAAVEDDPDSWRAWALLGLSYDASGDRKRARWAMREAIRLSRADARPLA